MKRLNFRLAFALAVVLLLAVAIFFNGIIGALRGARADLSEDRQYTLSDSAKDILSRLAVPVQVKFYITRADKMPTQLKTLERDVSDKLRDFSSASDGHLAFSIHDPSDDEELQTLIQSKGIRPFQVQSVEKDEIGVKLIYSAISIAYKDKAEEILPQVLPQSLSTLEYEIVSRVFRLTRDDKPVLAVFAPKPKMDPQMLSMYMQMGMQPPEMPDPWQPIIEMLGEEHYDVRRIDLTKESPIPAEANALLVMGPVDLNPRQAWEIGRALSRGVSALMAVQSMEYDYNPEPRGGFRITARKQRSGLEGLLQSYGLIVVPDHLFDAENEVISIPRTQNLGGMRIQMAEPVRAPMQIAVRGDQMNREISITNRIEMLFYLWGTDIVKDATKLVAQNLGCQPLFTASGKAWHMPCTGEPLTMQDIDPRGKEYGKDLALAYLVSGQFPDFGGGTPPPWPSAPTPPGEEAAAEAAAGAADAVVFNGAPAPAKLILVGCAKVFEDPFLGAGQNALLLLNSVDAMALGGELIGIRSKMITERSIKPVEAGQKLLYRVFTVVLMPVLITLYGILRLIMRRKESALYQESLARAR